MKHIGSQTRETLEEAQAKIHTWINDKEVVLQDEDGHLALYCENDDYAGYVIEIDGKGYEFCSSVGIPDIILLKRTSP